MDATNIIANQSSLFERELRRLLPVGSDYALIDFPNHQNVGDSAIWLGEMTLLERATHRLPKYTCDYHNYRKEDLNRVHPSGPILIHGGGNFGDLWPAHHILREQLLHDFPDRLIIQLPQTISFSDSRNAKRTAALIKKHGRFQIYVRDFVSEKYARQHFDCPVALLPDGAFGIGKISAPIPTSHDAFMLIREDLEKAGHDFSPLRQIPDVASADWLTEPAHFVSRTKAQTIFRKFRHDGLKIGRLDLYQRLAKGRLSRGLRLLSSGKVVITDRLHAHILSVLLDKPNIVLDNSYGKIFNYIDAWTFSYEKLWKVSSIQDALDSYRLAVEAVR